MTSDRWLVRLVGVTVCVSAFIAVLSIAVAAYRGVAVPDSVDRLGYLLAGGLLGALTTRLTGGDPLPVTTNPGDTVAVTEES